MKARFKLFLSKAVYCYSLVLPLLFSSCATNSRIPDWVSSKESIYPESSYIKGVGIGKTKEEAKTNSAAEIGLYFQSNIDSVIHTEFKDEITSNGTETNQKLIQNITLSSKITLSGLSYTQPFYNSKDKNWYCMAYISRKTAWELYQSEAQQAKMAFYALYNNISSEKPLEAYKWCIKSRAAADYFLEKLMFLNIIDSKKEKATYSADRQRIAELNVKIQNLKEIITIYLEIKNDVSNIAHNELAKTLSDLGFKIVSNKKSARYTANAEIFFHETKTIDDGDTIFTHIPSFSLLIFDSGKDIYTYETQLNKKIVSFIKTDAQLKSVKAISDLINKNFQTDFKANMEK